MSQETREVAPPSSARQLRTPSALALADLAAIFDDLQFTLRCCERLLTELERDGLDAVLVESLWVSALNSYARCFRPGERGMGLTEKDLGATGVQGEVVEWHGLLGRIRDFSLEGAVNPREAYSVGVSQAPTGRPEGIVITSVPHPLVDEVTVRQTGRLAFELSRLLDERIKEHQKKVFAAVEEMPVEQLGALPAIEVTAAS
ncbi:hypothetical protein [Amycolatopsis saalfeldensis]|uniref:Uncharacterized protein n=1 Tax=Amycolatopsis saalfeldensis TaxID=394193 RepID=A0A1H8UUL1_9PSEU|nr:hypothetical protein [Amycolatopsis saalfeldensis]SEP06683.1 hypothetical protein SAMN04489732_103464 [Amycolatopsis saalfeldensis]